MEISGLSYFNAYFQYTSNAATNNAETSPKVAAVSSKMESISTKAANASAIDIYQVSKSSASYPAFADVLSMQYKMDSVDAYQEELADAKMNDPEKYQKMVLESKGAAAKSFSQVAELAEINGGTATYNGVNISFDSENQQMNVGDMSDTRNVITVALSNGGVLRFNTNNIDDISKMLDMFSPEDIKHIMEAITKHNIAVSMQKEIDDAKASVASETAETAETADTAVQTGQISAAESASGESAPGGSSGNDDEPEVTSEIITNPDGSRKLVITTKIGDMETVTNIKLAPAAEENKLLKNQSFGNEGSKVDQVSDDTESERTSDSNRTEQSSGLQQATAFQRPTEFQSMHALNAYEANFMYAS